MSLVNIINEFTVENVEKEIEFYQKIFDFSVELTDGTPINWAQLKKDNVRIMLEEYIVAKEEIKNFPPKTESSNLLKFEYDSLEELKSIYNRCKENSCDIFIDYHTTEYHKTEFGVLDYDKNRIIVSYTETKE